MAQLVDVILVALMGVGLAYTMARLVGPFGLAMALRAWVLNLPLPVWMKDGVLCVYCWSFWLTLGSTVVVMHLESGSIRHPLDLVSSLIIWFAAYGLTVAIFLLADL